MEKSDNSKSKNTMFNGEWEVLSSLGEGNTAKVYKVRSVKDGKIAALKLIRERFLQEKSCSPLESIQQEI